MANLGLLSCVPQKDDTILMDALSHICIKEGVRLSRAKYHNFKHNDLIDLEKKLRGAIGNKFIVVEAIYSMDGHQAPLLELVALAKKYDAYLIVDEAHSTGLYGTGGNGLCCELGIEQEVFAKIYTFGKAPGAHGAVVAGTQLLKDYLINYSRQFIYTTAMPYHSTQTIRRAVEYRKDKDYLWNNLLEKVHLFKSEIDSRIKILDSVHPIQGIMFSGVAETLQMANFLKAKGFDISPIGAPTVPEGQERLRICLHTFNTDEEIKMLCKEVNSFYGY